MVLHHRCSIISLMVSSNLRLGRLKSQGIVAAMNSHAIAHRPAHIAIGTGSTAARNDINANSFHLVTSPFNKTSVALLHPSVATQSQLMDPLIAENTANPLWLRCKTVGRRSLLLPSRTDGLDIRVPGVLIAHHPAG